MATYEEIKEAAKDKFIDLSNYKGVFMARYEVHYIKEDRQWEVFQGSTGELYTQTVEEFKADFNL